MIGVFDSGIGGLTVVKALLERLPHHDIVYYGDTARSPYGTKSAETVTAYAAENTRFLLQKGATVVAIACNAAASVAFETLSARFDVRLFEVVQPAVQRALAATKNGRIGVIGTRATVNSGVYAKKIRQVCPEAAVFSVACPLLVPLVEEGWLKKPVTRMIVKNYLRSLKTRRIDTLILACTHYPLLTPIIQSKLGRKTVIVDSAQTSADAIQNAMRRPGEGESVPAKSGTLQIFVSDLTDQFLKTAQMILRQRIEIQKV